jgi:hypothetical protein
MVRLGFGLGALLLVTSCAMNQTRPRADLPDFDAMWDYNQPAQTERAFREVLRQTEDAADAAYRAELLTQIARTLGLQRRFDEAHALLDQVEPMLAGGGMDVPRVRWLLERGRTLNSSGLPERAAGGCSGMEP